MDEGRGSRWSVSNALRIIALFLVAIVLLLFLWKARALFLVAFLGVIAGLAVARAADWLEKHRVRRAFGAPLTMLVVAGALAGLFAVVAPAVREQSRDLAGAMPKMVSALETRFGVSPEQQEEGKSVVRRMLQQEMRGIGKLLFPVVSSTFEALAGLLIITFIALYIGTSPHTYRDGILHLVPHSHRDRAREALSDLAETLRGWLLARLMAMVIIGAVTAGGLMLLDVKAALALGIVAGLLELIPFYGPVIAAIPAIGVALVDSPQKGLAVALLYLVIQQLEGNVLTPIILKKRLDIPPVLTIVGVTALGMVFGVLGMLAAEPLIAGTLVLVKRLYVRDVVGDDLK